MNEAGYSLFKLIKVLMTHAVEIGAEMMRQTDEACRDADLVTHTFAHAVGAHTLARERNIPDVHTHGRFPNVHLPNLGNRFFESSFAHGIFDNHRANFIIRI